jgi:hypothetical protein
MASFITISCFVKNHERIMHLGDRTSTTLIAPIDICRFIFDSLFRAFSLHWHSLACTKDSFGNPSCYRTRKPEWKGFVGASVHSLKISTMSTFVMLPLLICFVLIVTIFTPVVFMSLRHCSCRKYPQSIFEAKFIERLWRYLCSIALSVAQLLT